MPALTMANTKAKIATAVITVPLTVQIALPHRTDINMDPTSTVNMALESSEANIKSTMAPTNMANMA